MALIYVTIVAVTITGILYILGAAFRNLRKTCGMRSNRPVLTRVAVFSCSFYTNEVCIKLHSIYPFEYK